jgi:hypothetical protein
MIKKQKYCQLEQVQTDSTTERKQKSIRKEKSRHQNQPNNKRQTRAQSNHPKSSTTTGRAKKATRRREVVRRKSCEANWAAIVVTEGWSREEFKPSICLQLIPWPVKC